MPSEHQKRYVAPTWKKRPRFVYSD
jgi:hypothetical protein